MIPQEIIRRKRDGEELDPADISSFIAALSDGQLSEGQIGAFAMAVWFKGMSRKEIVALTLAMANSGDRLQWADIGRPIADKHSTGGVGDNVSLMLAPIAAACGLAVPMISGRGLGHTGGTLDKLESIPGYVITPDSDLFHRVVKGAGFAIIGQTGSLAPADGRLYAVRDVTATVDSIPLITASILSKKLAAGLETLVLDVKLGNGAFMADRGQAEMLARSLVEVANGAGVKTSALITDMNEPLADCAGNAVEMRNCLDFLAGRKTGTRLETVVFAFAAEMLVKSGIASSCEEADAMARRALSSGRAAESFGRMVSMLGGPADLVENPERYLAGAPVEREVPAARSGWMAACDARGIGISVIDLGGGRRHPSDRIDHRVGFSGLLRLGTWVDAGDPIAVVHAACEAAAEKAVAALAVHYRIADDRPELAPVIAGRV
ncbi:MULTISPECIES: thymidine phosphorylase [unclassified Rhizobium]|uniref:thymidine phosphorylase n=1 Tax=unclassified Rhizobium TaxID=2613769 RepID=UPI001C82F647|nr:MULTISPECIES: thymidine phosphorylase [unclassified Rhizobium]MBX5218369.1 thymidine phosphorylase [Rhizobium sp. NLR9a]MBX5248407.1 thymidine phosphorylase [Rhizobium sp. NLR3b]MBX5279017.1 thymidine phosphorylase [Rhizobium sp. NLR13a]MBX5285067.1 thymidine phosphorylase [Rhizobium sp. NLR10a]MBX5296897.1 thymidine phosphorylase [Rhizobium sp. NLR15a]